MIPRGRLMSPLEEKIADGPVLSLIESSLKADILDGMEGWTPEACAPQGAVPSPPLSNIDLDPPDHDETKLTDGDSLRSIIGSLNRTLRGWFESFRHDRGWQFRLLDGWIRGRLRSILRNRNERRGRGGGLDHQRWPSALFAEQGLVQSGGGPCLGPSILSEVRPSTGGPDAGDSQVRFGGRGGPNQWAYSTPIPGTYCFSRSTSNSCAVR